MYVIGSILRSRRYGAISSRIGKMKNEVLGILVSDCEVFSNNELTQKVYDKLIDTGVLESPIQNDGFETSVKESIKELSEDIFGQVEIIEDEEKSLIVSGIKTIMRDETKLSELLEKQTKAYKGNK